MRLVGDAAEVGAAAGAGLAVTAVHHPVVADLVREPALPLALDLEAVGQTLRSASIRRSRAGLVEAGEAGEGRDPGLVEGVVAVAPADPGDGALVAQDRVDPAAVVALPEELLALGGVDVGAELDQRPVVAFGQDPPAGLALGAELLDEDGRRVVEAEADDGALGLGRLGRILDVDPPALGEVDEEPGPAELEDEVLAPPPDPLDRLADEASPARARRS